MSGPASFERFAAGLVEQFDLHAPSVRRDASLADDLLFDSFATLMLILWIEESSGLLVPCIDLPELRTVDDAYAYYAERYEQAAAERAELTDS